MPWRFRATCIAALVLSLSAPVAANTLTTQAEWNTAVRKQVQRKIVTPPAVLRAGRTLDVQVRIDILADGTLDAVTVSRSSGDPAVDDATIAMIRRAGRLPAFTPDIKAEKQSLMLPVRYVVEGSGNAPRAAAPAPAAQRTYANDALGLQISVPAPFHIAGHRKTSRYDVLVEIASASGGPPAVGGGNIVCTVGYQTTRVTKATSKHAPDSPEAQAARLAAVRNVQAAQGATLETLDSFVLAGIHGVDYVVAPGMQGNAGAGDIRQYTALYDAPQARAVLACATTRAAMASALPAFRQIRDGVGISGR